MSWSLNIGSIAGTAVTQQIDIVGPAIHLRGYCRSDALEKRTIIATKNRCCGRKVTFERFWLMTEALQNSRFPPNALSLNQTGRRRNVAAKHPFMNLTTCFRVLLLQGDKQV